METKLKPVNGRGKADSCRIWGPASFHPFNGLGFETDETLFRQFKS